MVKNLPANAETQELGVQSLGLEESLEEGVATHFGTLAWKIPWTEEPGGLQSMGSQESAPGFQLWLYFHLYMCFVHWGFSQGCPG